MTISTEAVSQRKGRKELITYDPRASGRTTRAIIRALEHALDNEHEFVVFQCNSSREVASLRIRFMDVLAALGVPFSRDMQANQIQLFDSYRGLPISRIYFVSKEDIKDFSPNVNEYIWRRVGGGVPKESVCITGDHDV